MFHTVPVSNIYIRQLLAILYNTVSLQVCFQQRINVGLYSTTEASRYFGFD